MKIFPVFFIPVVTAHSWLECTDYKPPSTDPVLLGTYNRALCDGYPRAFARQFEAGFGVDTGYNFEFDKCPTGFREGDYNAQMNMAEYVSGQVIHLSHPSKNHVADVCTNPFIPTEPMELLMSSQPGVDTFDQHLQILGGEHVNGKIDYLGFQRCFNFCENTDKAHCITSWTLPQVTTPGRYTFRWKWKFHPEDVYSNCFDAMISVDGVVPTSPPSGSGNGSGNGTITQPPSSMPTPSPSTPSNSPTQMVTPTPTQSTSAPTPTPTEDTSIQPQPTQPPQQTQPPVTPSPPQPTQPTQPPSTQSPETQPPATVKPITSDSAQIKSILSDFFKRFSFNGTVSLFSD